jgi:hypothetical protein
LQKGISNGAYAGSKQECLINMVHAVSSIGQAATHLPHGRHVCMESHATS